MAEIIMPKMGDAMTEGKVVRWYKKAGDAVKKGEPVLEIETDKVNLDLEAEQDGTLGDRAAGGRWSRWEACWRRSSAREEAAPEGAAAPRRRLAVNSGAEEPRQDQCRRPRTPRAIDKKDSIKQSTGEYGEAIEMKAPRIDRTAPPPRTSWRCRRTTADETLVAAGAEDGARHGRQPRTGAGERAARDASSPATSRTSRTGRTAPASPEARLGCRRCSRSETKQIPLSAMRRTIAKRLAESTGPIPHFYLTADYDVTNLLSLREQLNEIEGIKTSVNDFIVRAAALALRHHPNVNASWGDEAITQHGEIHIGIAVSTPEGLITPVVRNADQKSVADIAAGSPRAG